MTSSKSASTASESELGESGSDEEFWASLACSSYSLWAKGVDVSLKAFIFSSIESLSSVFNASSSSAIPFSIASFSDSSTLSFASSKVFLQLWTRFSPMFFTWTNSSNFLSASALASASLTIWSISSSDKPLEDLITIDCSFPVALSLAETFKIPFASRSKLTSIWGMPLGAAGISAKLNWPKVLFPAACFLSPCKTWTVTAVWLSSAVENICDLLVGIVVFLSIRDVITPPIVSIPKVNGVTSSKRTSVTSPAKTAPWIAAPTATASSGLTSFLGSFPKNSFTFSWTKGILVCPPTTTISSISEGFNLASSKATWTGLRVFDTKSETKDSNFALVNFKTKCLGPEASAVM